MMSREIKFRVWCKIDKCMYHNVQEGITFEDNSAYMFSDFLNNVGYHEFDVMQFTGLQDKNGKDIYEGDIFEIKHRSTIRFEIVYAKLEEFRHEPVYACFAMKRGDDIIPFDEHAMEYGAVIGNIHENPEEKT